MNECARLDPEFAADLEKLSGTVIAIEITGTGLSAYLVLDADRIRLLSPDEYVEFAGPPPQVTLAGPPVSLLRRLTRLGDDEVVVGDQVQISGDVAVLQQLRTMFARLEIDWEEQLSRLVGDVAAHQMALGAGHLWQWGRQLADTLVRDTAEFLIHEAEMLTTRRENEGFSDAVDDLREDVERMELRIARLSQAGTDSGP